jgi:hypothetical protein
MPYQYLIQRLAGIQQILNGVELVNRCIRVLKAVLNFGLDKEMLERNVVARFRRYQGRGERAVKRGAFSEGEIRSLISAARLMSGR